MKNIYLITVTLLFILPGCMNAPDKKEKGAEKEEYNSRLFIDLPGEYNTPDGLAMAPDSSLILSVPNFNNRHLIDSGLIDQPSPAFMARIDRENRISRWYEFKEEDLHPQTGKMGPMDGAYGPDGNLYVADMQIFFDDDHQSRLIRINVENGMAMDMDVVATGFIASNGVFWYGNTLFVTESVLQSKDDTLYSGVYAFSLEELTSGVPVELEPFYDGVGDAHLVVHFISDNHMGFGADGVTFDDEGYLYTTVIEKGEIYRSTLDVNQNALQTVLFAEDPQMKGPDGMIYDPVRKNFYVADFLNNAVHAIDKEGNVTTLQKNGDVTGANGGLDQPAEVILRGNELIVVNMDMAWATRGIAVNTEVDGEYNLAVIHL